MPTAWPIDHAVEVELLIFVLHHTDSVTGWWLQVVVVEWAEVPQMLLVRMGAVLPA